MGDDDLAVLGDLGVELERAHAQVQGGGEAGDGRLGVEADATAMGLQVELGLDWREVTSSRVGPTEPR